MFSATPGVTAMVSALVMLPASPPSGPPVPEPPLPPITAPGPVVVAPVDPQPAPTTIPPFVPPDLTIADAGVFVMMTPVVEFDQVELGEAATDRITIDNDGDDPVSVGAITVSDDTLSVVETDCGEMVAAGGSCSISIRFAPTSVGAYEGSVDALVDGDVETTLVIATVSDGSGSAVPTVPVDPTPTAAPPTSQPPSSAPTTDRGEGDDGVDGPPDPTATTTPVPDLVIDDEQFRECERRARTARVSRAERLEMTVGLESVVTVEVAVGSTAIDVGDTVPGTTVSDAELSCLVVAVLIGSETDFEIEEPVQSGDFTRADRLRWQWDVTPRTPGDHDLDLRIIPRLRYADDFHDGTPRTFQTTIDVSSAPRSTWQQVGDGVSTVADHPLFRLAVIGGGFVGAAGAVARRRARHLAARLRAGGADASVGEPSDRGYL